MKKVNNDFPSILDTFKVALKSVFFDNSAILKLTLNKKHTLNLITIFIFMLSLPVKGIDGKISYDIGHIIETTLLTLFFILFLYLLSPNKKISLGAFFRIFLAYEVIDIVALITVILPTKYLTYFYACHIAWYLSLSIFAFSRINNINYLLSTFFVMLTFIIVNLFPVIL